jgi:hypothetical protein
VFGSLVDGKFNDEYAIEEVQFRLPDGSTLHVPIDWTWDPVDWADPNLQAGDVAAVPLARAVTELDPVTIPALEELKSVRYFGMIGYGGSLPFKPLADGSFPQFDQRYLRAEVWPEGEARPRKGTRLHYQEQWSSFTGDPSRSLRMLAPRGVSICFADSGTGLLGFRSRIINTLASDQPPMLLGVLSDWMPYATLDPMRPWCVPPNGGIFASLLSANAVALFAKWKFNVEAVYET